MELAELLDIRPGVTAVIGGGGKTTLLRTLGEELSRTHTVLLCTTTKIFPFQFQLRACFQSIQIIGFQIFNRLREQWVQSRILL